MPPTNGPEPDRLAHLSDTHDTLFVDARKVRITMFELPPRRWQPTSRRHAEAAETGCATSGAEWASPGKSPRAGTRKTNYQITADNPGPTYPPDGFPLEFCKSSVTEVISSVIVEI